MADYTLKTVVTLKTLNILLSDLVPGCFIYIALEYIVYLKICLDVFFDADSKSPLTQHDPDPTG